MFYVRWLDSVGVNRCRDFGNDLLLALNWSDQLRKAGKAALIFVQ